MSWCFFLFTVSANIWRQIGRNLRGLWFLFQFLSLLLIKRILMTSYYHKWEISTLISFLFNLVFPIKRIHHLTLLVGSSRTPTNIIYGCKRQPQRRVKVIPRVSGRKMGSPVFKKHRVSHAPPPRTEYSLRFPKLGSTASSGAIR